MKMFPSVSFIKALLLLTVSCALLTPSGWAQTGTQRGATLGGIAGAVAGGLIGDHNGEAGAGAAIGGALGAVAGGLLGNADDRDAQLARQQYYYQQQQLQQQQVLQTQSAVSVSDVVSMSRSGLSDAVIANQIRRRGVQHSLQVADIIALHQQGVHENVITAMQEATVGDVARGPSTATTVVTPAPVIIEREVLPYYPVPRYHGPVYHYYRGPHPHPRAYYEFHYRH